MFKRWSISFIRLSVIISSPGILWNHYQQTFFLQASEKTHSMQIRTRHQFPQKPHLFLILPWALKQKYDCYMKMFIHVFIVWKLKAPPVKVKSAFNSFLRKMQSVGAHGLPFAPQASFPTNGKILISKGTWWNEATEKVDLKILRKWRFSLPTERPTSSIHALNFPSSCTSLFFLLFVKLTLKRSSIIKTHHRALIDVSPLKERRLLLLSLHKDEICSLLSLCSGQVSVSRSLSHTPSIKQAGCTSVSSSGSDS